MKELAIFAGRGALPAELALLNPNALVISFRGQGLDFKPARHIDAQFEKSGKLFSTLRREGISKICFAGAITRPDLSPWKMDFKTIKMMPKIRQAIADSDANALSIIRGLVESEGFEVVGAHELAPQMLAEKGVMGLIKGTPAKLDRARAIHKAMSELDIGQALVMRNDQCLSIETLPGTKAMLEFVSKQGGEGGYLYKASKLDQDLSMDMASIGLETIEEVKNAGLDGIVLGATTSLILNKSKVIKAADDAGLYVIGD